jgi:hypothetical protein
MGWSLSGSVGIGKNWFERGKIPSRGVAFDKNAFPDSKNPILFPFGLSACAPPVPV